MNTIGIKEDLYIAYIKRKVSVCLNSMLRSLLENDSFYEFLKFSNVTRKERVIGMRHTSLSPISALPKTTE